MKNSISLLCLLVLASGFTSALGNPYFPDTKEYKTLICDLHTHTVFSDGLVWPTVRIDEADREGLDAIAISDHIEYQPHKNDIPTNHNRPFAIAKEIAKEKNILLIKAAEITRDTPPGHYNALYLHDIDPLEIPEFLKVIETANEQNAFVFWNHHSWKGEDRGHWGEVQTILYDNQWLHGMEVANGGSYYPNAHAWCLEKNLTMLGNSDIHAPSIDYQYTADEHRTLTLVFAAERTVESIKQALLARRTAVWHNNRLIGRADHLKPLFDRCVTVSKPHHVNGSNVAFFEIANSTLIDLNLKRNGQTGPAAITLPARSTIIARIKLSQDRKPVPLSYTVSNLLVAPDKGLPIEFTVSVEK
ncbi:MAG: Sb-PDE family phosphodiesterase [Phycisphaerae bacterium]|nr:Sb-PDE family phosphodiesterase [Phycisphaerae bacterium]